MLKAFVVDTSCEHNYIVFVDFTPYNLRFSEFKYSKSFFSRGKGKNGRDIEGKD